VGPRQASQIEQTNRDIAIGYSEKSALSAVQWACCGRCENQCRNSVQNQRDHDHKESAQISNGVFLYTHWRV